MTSRIALSLTSPRVSSGSRTLKANLTGSARRYCTARSTSTSDSSCGQHSRAIGVAPELSNVDHGAPVDGPRQAHVETARRRLDVLAEARDHRSFGGLVQVESSEQNPAATSPAPRVLKPIARLLPVPPGRRRPRLRNRRTGRAAASATGAAARRGQADPFRGRRCQGFSFLPGSFQAIASRCGCLVGIRPRSSRRRA